MGVGRVEGERQKEAQSIRTSVFTVEALIGGWLDGRRAQ